MDVYGRYRYIYIYISNYLWFGPTHPVEHCLLDYFLLGAAHLVCYPSYNWAEKTLLALAIEVTRHL